jgi:hypothetical protein
MCTYHWRYCSQWLAPARYDPFIQWPGVSCVSAGCRCLSGYKASWDWKSLPSGTCTVKRLLCTPERGVDPGAVFGVSFAVSVVGLLLLGYCLYVSWYGRWGLPKLKRVSQGLSLCSFWFHYTFLTAAPASVQCLCSC